MRELKGQYDSSFVTRYSSFLKYALLMLFAVFFLFPMYWLVLTSLKTQADQFSMPPVWWTKRLTLDYYRAIIFDSSFETLAFNSALACGGSALLSFVPLFLIMRALGLLDTRLALVLAYSVFNLPFVVWMMKGFFDELPRELEESALVDGDTHLGAFLRIVLPLVAPGIAATAIFCMIVSWNEFLFALILTQTDSALTLPVGIANQVTQYEIRWGVMSAAGVVAMTPMFIFALMVQRYLVRGLSFGAVKG